MLRSDFGVGDPARYPTNRVSGALLGRMKWKRAHAHNAAVLLGLKEGVVERRDNSPYPRDFGGGCDGKGAPEPGTEV